MKIFFPYFPVVLIMLIHSTYGQLMKKLVFEILTISLCIALPSNCAQQMTLQKQASTDADDIIVYFSPPAKWQLADSKALPPSVRMMVLGKGQSGLPPSINISSEPYQGTLKQYLKSIKNLTAARGEEWKDLGNITTDAGTGNLSQVDYKSQWGLIRSMQVILLKNKIIYIMNASALKEEFANFYKDFFASMRSLKITKDIYELVPDPKQRMQLKADASKLLKQWKEQIAAAQTENPEITLSDLQEKIFNSTDFQSHVWTPFKESIKNNYKQISPEWYGLFLQKIEDQLYSM